jgi:hypothetical protein
MIRCKCGVWTEYGLTCVNCRQDAYRNLLKSIPVDEIDEACEPIDDDEDELLDED